MLRSGRQFHESCKGCEFHTRKGMFFGASQQKSRRARCRRPMRLLQARAHSSIGQRGRVLLVPSFGYRSSLCQVSASSRAAMLRLQRDGGWWRRQSSVGIFRSFPFASGTARLSKRRGQNHKEKYRGIPDYYRHSLKESSPLAGSLRKWQ
jgi:hypothetical protein